MSKSNTHENDYLKLIFNNVTMTLVGDAAGILASAAARRRTLQRVQRQQQWPSRQQELPQLQRSHQTV